MKPPCLSCRYREKDKIITHQCVYCLKRLDYDMFIRKGKLILKHVRTSYALKFLSYDQIHNQTYTNIEDPNFHKQFGYDNPVVFWENEYKQCKRITFLSKKFGVGNQRMQKHLHNIGVNVSGHGKHNKYQNK